MQQRVPGEEDGYLIGQSREFFSSAFFSHDSQEGAMIVPESTVN